MKITIPSMIVCLFILLFGKEMVAQQTKRMNDSIFEQKGKKIALAMNANPGAVIDEAIAFVVFTDTNEFEYRSNAPFQARQILAALYGRTGQFEKAVQLHKECLSIVMEQKNDPYIAVTYYNLAVANYRHGYQFIGQQYLDSAMVYYQKAANINGLLKSYSLYMAIFSDKEAYDQVLAYSDVALKIIDTISPMHQMHHNYLNELKAGFYISRGKAFMNFDNIKEAIINFNLALKYAEESELSQMNLSASINVAKIYIRQKKWKNFDVLVRKNIQLAKEIEDDLSLYELITLQAEKESKQGNHDHALQLLESIEQEANALSDIDFEIDFNQTKADILKKKEDFKAAMSYEGVVDSLMELKMSQKNSLLAEELSQRFRLSEKELTINILNKNQALQEQLLSEKEKSRKLYQGLSVLLALIILIIIFLLQRNYQKNKKLKLLNNFQKKVFTVLSHDIRNYSSAIQISPELTLQLLKKNELEKAKNILHDMQEKLQSLHQSLSNILFWAAPQIKEDKMKAVSEINVANEIAQHTSLYQSISQNYGIEILTPDKNNEVVLIHRAAFEVIIRNLISNALKHSKASYVSFEYEIIGNSLLLKLKDNGIGLQQDQIDRLTAANTKDALNNKRGFGLWLINYYCGIAGIAIHYEKTEQFNIFVFTFPIQHA